MVSAIVVAAGSGRRMNRRQPKQYLSLNGQTILGTTLSVFNRCPQIDEILIVAPEGDIDYCRNEIIGRVPVEKPFQVIAGGGDRQASVLNGLRAIRRKKNHWVAIHDGVRPFVSVDLIQKCIQHAEKLGACVPCIQAADTVKLVSKEGFVEQTLNRGSIRMVQTPQVFRLDRILQAHESALSEGYRGTDDASLAERMGIPVAVIPGSSLNLKITTPEDLALARAVFSLAETRG